MNIQDLWEICPPERSLSHPIQLNYDIDQYKLKIQNRPNEYPVYTDSADLIQLLKRDRKKIKEYEPYDLMTNIHYRKSVFKNNIKYHYRISRAIHYGNYRQEKSFMVQSDSTDNPNILDQLYTSKVKEKKEFYKLQLEKQCCTYFDILLINRRLIPFNWRAMSRMSDRKVIIFPFNWLENKLL